MRQVHLPYVSATLVVGLVLSTAGIVGVVGQDDCAAEGKRSIECGARKGPAKCCGGLVCPKDGDKQCVKGRNGDKDKEEKEETAVTETPTASVVTNGSSLIDDADTVYYSPTASPVLSSSVGEGLAGDIGSVNANTAASALSFDNLDLLRPAIDGIKPSGGISSAIFGNHPARRWDVLVDLNAPSSAYRQQQVEPYRLRSSPTVMERDPFKFTEMPSAMPSSEPTVQHSSAPSASPSARPSSTPTDYLWVSEPLPSTESMENDDAYFDYNPYSPRGPNSWDKVKDAPESQHWDELQKYIDPDLEDNECGNTKSRRQSPIDVRFDKADGQCFEYHEIRHRDGEFSVADPKVEAQILPTKLRIDYPYVVLDPDELKDMSDNKRPGWSEVKYEIDEDGEKKFVAKDAVKGPSADIPKGWGYQLPVTHVDVKIPSEHWMEGKQYAAEYQIYLIQNRKAQRGAPAISILIDLDPDDKPNAALQVALDRFQKEWDTDMAECEAKQRKERRLGAILGEGIDATQMKQSTWLDEPEEEEVKFQTYLRGLQDDRSNQGGYTYFNPWDSEIMRSIYFFGYEGSLTEPPCTEFLEWRVMDTPTTVSKAQLFQMKKLLFHHVDGSCKRTSTHYEGSVARPLQPYNGRMVHRCMCRDFFSDEQRRKKNLDARRCEEDNQEEFGFSRDVFTDEWFERTHRWSTPAHQDCKVFGDCEKYNKELAEIRAAEAAAAAKEAAEKAAKEARERAKEAAQASAWRPAPAPRPANRPANKPAKKPSGTPWWASF